MFENSIQLFSLSFSVGSIFREGKSSVVSIIMDKESFTVEKCILLPCKKQNEDSKLSLKVYALSLEPAFL